jgi:peptidoglycan DL-endopeptidase CwlO
MIKKSIIYTISAAILATMIQVTPTFANPTDSPVTQGQIENTQEQINDFETQIQQLDNQITISMENSQKLNDQINIQTEKIEQKKAQIEKAKKDLDTHKKVYSERLQSLQLDGQQSIVAYAELLLSSTNISQFFTRFTAISQIIKSDTDLLNGLNDKEQALKDAEELLHNEFEQLKNNQDELASEQKKIEADKIKVEKALAEAKDKLQIQQDQLSQQEAQAQAQLAQQAQQGTQQQSPKNNASAPAPLAAVPSVPGSDAANKVIVFAKQYLGVPYVWGGTTPSGFDCSGFTQYVYRSVGINLPRVSRDQQNVGQRISVNQVQPGDLVFNGSPAYHVGIYIGGGQYIHAPQTGDVVKIAPYNPSRFSSAARILP